MCPLSKITREVRVGSGLLHSTARVVTAVKCLEVHSHCIVTGCLLPAVLLFLQVYFTAVTEMTRMAHMLSVVINPDWLAETNV